MVVGEAPGRFEDEQGRPFVGRAGQLLDELLAEAGLARGEVFITNVVKARPPRQPRPHGAEVEHWMPVLEAAARAGRAAARRARSAATRSRTSRPGAKIGEVHGALLVERGRALYPLYHPAAALRSTKLRETLFADARGIPGALASTPRGWSVCAPRPRRLTGGPWRSWRSPPGRRAAAADGRAAPRRAGPATTPCRAGSRSPRP